jgi:hypothetical protein
MMMTMNATRRITIFTAALIFLVTAVVVVVESAPTTLSTTAGVVLNASRNKTPAILANKLLEFALFAPQAPDDAGSPEWPEWNRTMHAALPPSSIPIQEALCPPNVTDICTSDWYWSFCGPYGAHGSYGADCNALFEYMRNAMTSCISAHREHIYVNTGMVPVESGGFWSSMSRCTHVARFIEDNMFRRPESGLASLCNVPDGLSSLVVRGYTVQGYRTATTVDASDSQMFGNILDQVDSAGRICANSGYGRAIADSPPIKGRWLAVRYEATVDALSFDDATASLGANLAYSRDAFWAIPPPSKLVYVANAPDQASLPPTGVTPPPRAPGIGNNDNNNNSGARRVGLALSAIVAAVVVYSL